MKVELRQSPRIKTGNWIHHLLRIVALTLFAWVIYRNRAMILSVATRELHIGVYFLSALLFLLALFASFIRWYFLALIAGLSIGLRDALRLGSIGNVFNFVIPGSISGDIVKAGYLSAEQSKKTPAIASIVMDRVVGLLGLLLLATIAGIASWSTLTDGVRGLVLLLGTISAILSVALFLILRPPLQSLLVRPIPKVGKLEIVRADLISVGQAYRHASWRVAGVLAFSMFVHLALVVVFYGISIAMFPNNSPSFLEHILLVPLIIASTAIPLPFGALGLSEQLSAELFAVVGHPGGAVVMLGFRLLLVIGALVSLFIYLANPSLQVHKTYPVEENKENATVRSD